MMLRAGIALCIVASALAAQTKTQSKQQGRPAATASVEGDVYLTMKSGDTKRGTGQQVYLMRDDDGTLEQRARSFCTNAALRVGPLATWYNALRADSEPLARSGSDKAPSLYELASREARISKGINAIEHEATDSTIALLGRSTADSTSSGMSAHYAFRGIKPGKYLVYANWMISDVVYQWLAPVTVAGGSPTTRDLDNSVVHEGLICEALSGQRAWFRKHP